MIVMKLYFELLFMHISPVKEFRGAVHAFLSNVLVTNVILTNNSAPVRFTIIP